MDKVFTPWYDATKCGPTRTGWYQIRYGKSGLIAMGWFDRIYFEWNLHEYGPELFNFADADGDEWRGITRDSYYIESGLASLAIFATASRA